MTATAKGSARRPPAPRPRPVRPAPEPPAEGDGGQDGFQVLRLKTSANGHKAKRVPLFYIDETEYTMLAEPTASLALRYLDVQQRDGLDGGFAFAVEQMIGRDAYEALLNYEQLTPGQFTQVSKVIIDTLLGALDTPKDS